MSSQIPQQSRTEVFRASPPMFESRWLDALSRVHPAVVPLIFGPAIAVLLTLALRRMAVSSVALALVGGYVFWTLSEYWIHRAIFHFEPQQGLGARLHWIIHGVHHDHPNDPLRLVMPPAVSIPLASAFIAAFVLVLGTPVAWGVGAGFLSGYLLYDMTHYALHHSRPRTRLGRRLRELHMRHHFEDDERGFGISAPWWDVVFGTFSPRVGETRREQP
jgi:sterol desaturase/sphingolipid hydroxylase (fatty acid hydroxylase superfamily)